MVESSLLGWAWIGLVIWSRSFETMRSTTEDEGTTSYAVPEKCLRGNHVKTWIRLIASFDCFKID
jgi:hypothetical protein